jgi:hypothetical protein
MTSMDDLVTWLRAQLDDDERVIGAACLHIDDCGGSGFASHFDDDRLLAEVEAKRRILDLADPAVMKALGTQDPGFRDGYVAACEDAIKAIAQPYAGRDGFRDEWRP